MSTYTPILNYTAKDALTTGDSLKKIKGSELDAELAAIVVAVDSKANSVSPTLTGTVTVSGTTIAGNATITGNNTFSGVNTFNSDLIASKIKLSATTEELINGQVQLVANSLINWMGTNGYFLKTGSTGAAGNRFSVANDGASVVYNGSGTAPAGGSSGNMGAGTHNCHGSYDAGNRVFSSTSMYEFVGGISTSSANGNNHGLGSVPKLWQVLVRCTTATLGYSVDDEVAFTATRAGAASERQVPGWVSASQIGCLMADEFFVMNKSTQIGTAVPSTDFGNWNLVLRAWK